jgi:hypothetical protein
MNCVGRVAKTAFQVANLEQKTKLFLALRKTTAAPNVFFKNQFQVRSQIRLFK